MKKKLLLCYTLFLFTTGFAQITAVTSNGDEVILNSDGTWKYTNIETVDQNKIDTSKLTYTKSANSTFVVKTSKFNCGIYIDPKKWSFAKSKIDEESEFDFTLKGKDAYAVIISEKTEIPLETLGNLAFDNAKDAAPDMAIIKKEYRNVNGHTVLFIHMRGSIKGIKVTYYGYYLSSTEGTVQLLSYCATNLFNDYKNELEQFLNGLSLLKQ